MIEGYLTKVTPVFGEGPMDSLMNAMTLVKKFHDENHEIVPRAKSRKVARKSASRKARGKVTTPKVKRKRSRPPSRKDTTRP
jgi:hypothetical protein